jgi:hypothetical protein
MQYHILLNYLTFCLSVYVVCVSQINKFEPVGSFLSTSVATNEDLATALYT